MRHEVGSPLFPPREAAKIQKPFSLLEQKRPVPFGAGPGWDHYQKFGSDDTITRELVQFLIQVLIQPADGGSGKLVPAQFFGDGLHLPRGYTLHLHLGERSYQCFLTTLLLQSMREVGSVEITSALAAGSQTGFKVRISLSHQYHQPKPYPRQHECYGSRFWRSGDRQRSLIGREVVF
jgi:hypothetical protein